MLISVELYVDEPKFVVLTNDWFDRLEEDDIDAISIMIDQSDSIWKSAYNENDIERLLLLADKRAVEVIVSYWPFPNINWMNSAFADLDRLCAVGPINAVEADVEFNINAKYVRGYESCERRDEHGKRIVSALEMWAEDYIRRVDELQNKYDVRKEIDTFTSHTENGRCAIITPHMDRIYVQAYSVSYRPDGHGGHNDIPYEHIYGPGNMQKMSLDRTMLIPAVRDGSVQVGYAHAIFGQNFVNHDPYDTMMCAAKAALNHETNPVWIRSWSSKHRNYNSYARRFLRDIRTVAKNYDLWGKEESKYEQKGQIGQ